MVRLSSSEGKSEFRKNRFIGSGGMAENVVPDFVFFYGRCERCFGLAGGFEKLSGWFWTEFRKCYFGLGRVSKCTTRQLDTFLLFKKLREKVLDIDK